MTAGASDLPPADRSALVVSACLLGVPCTHRGEAKTASAVADLSRRFRLIPVCPEVAGGLTTPRPSAEIQADGTVATEAGVDVTSAYRRGAGQAVALAVATGAVGAVLKARSPSCGAGEVYDGSFTKRLRPGMGVTAAALREAGFEVHSEEDVGSADWQTS